MTIKYKLDFTIDSDVLFGLLSKFLPIQDLHVEEVSVVSAPDQAIRFDKQFDLPKPKRAPQVRRKKGSGYALNPHAGVNAILLAFLQDGMPHFLSESFPTVRAAGYSSGGMYSRIERLVRHGYIVRLAKGQYQLTPKGKERAA